MLAAADAVWARGWHEEIFERDGDPDAVAHRPAEVYDIVSAWR